MRAFIYQIYDWVYAYYFSGQWRQILVILKIVALAVSFLLAIFILFLLFRIRTDIKKSLKRVSESIAGTNLPQKVFHKRWQSILKKAESEDEDSQKLAIIEADKMLDDLLKETGLKGENMGERLKQIDPNQIANLEALWEAHKIRNRIVHEPDYRLKPNEVKEVIEIYRRALEDLGAL